MNVLQSWDDGVVDDIRLASIFRAHGARAAFNLNPGLHESTRAHGWRYGDKEVLRLARGELERTYAGFEIANHTRSHPDLTRLPAERLEVEISDARKILQDWFNQPVEGFCYPFGRATPEVQKVIEETGHRFARNAGELQGVAPGSSFRLIDPSCHFSDPAFWTLYEHAMEVDSCFFFWGHSYELDTEDKWRAIEAVVETISGDPRARWMTPGEFMAAQPDQARSKSRK